MNWTELQFVSGRKRGRDLNTVTEERVFKRRKQRNPVADSEPLVNGITDPTQEQVEVTQSVWYNREMYNRSFANMNGGLKNIIPGFMSDKDKILDMRVGDPGMAFTRDMSNAGMDHVKVFSPLNGIDVSGYMNSFDMDADMHFLGWMMANYGYGEAGTSKVPASLQLSVCRTVLNTGYTDKKAGDAVAIITPLFDNSKYCKDPSMKLGKNWIFRHSGSGKTMRVLPKLVTVTSKYITDIYRDIFYKLFINSSHSTKMKLFPTRKWPIKPTGQSDFQMKELTPHERLAVTAHNSDCHSAMCAIYTLIQAGIIDGVRNSVVRAQQNQKKQAMADLLEDIAYNLGYATTSAKAEQERTDGERMKIRRLKIVNEFVKLKYYSYLYKDMKKHYDLMFQQTMNPELARLFTTNRANQDAQIQLLLIRLDRVIGVTTKGGKKGQKFDIDSGRPKYVF